MFPLHFYVALGAPVLVQGSRFYKLESSITKDVGIVIFQIFALYFMSRKLLDMFSSYVKL